MIDLLNKLVKYDFKLSRGKDTVAECLDRHFRNYIKDLEEWLKNKDKSNKDEFYYTLNKKIKFIEKICKEIVEVSKLHRDGKIRESYAKSEELFNNLSDYLCTCKINENGEFYRIRKGDFRIKEGEESKKKKAELFHIKNSERNLVNSYRYSISGFPCLYLSQGFELAWFECGMPSQFSYCKMRLDEKQLRLIDFSENPYSLKFNIINCSNKIGDKENIYKELLNYIITYPIAIACSLKVEKRDDSFVEEYVIPQMLMLWIKNSNKFDGVIYKSSLNTTLIKGVQAKNVVLPTKEFRKDGLDKRLTENIKLSDIGYFDVNNHFKDYQKNLSELENFKQNLAIKEKSNSMKMVYDYMRIKYINNIEQICDTINITYNSLMRGNYSNIDLVFHNIDCIFFYICTIYNSIEHICIDIEDFISNKKLVCDKVNLIKDMEDDINKFFDISTKIVKPHTAFDFEKEELYNFEKI